MVVRTVDRRGLGAAQTPQGVRRSPARARVGHRFAPERPGGWTDEAALLEACTITVHAIPGDPGNLKVTLPADLRPRRAALGGDLRAARVGFG